MSPDCTEAERVAARVGVTLWTRSGKPERWSRSQLLTNQAATESSKPTFIFFWGHHDKRTKDDAAPASDGDGALGPRCFSQWWKASSEESSAQFTECTDDYVCAEQYMMAWKARVFGDEATREAIMKSKEPFAIKALGRRVKPFDTNVWDAVAFSIVAEGNYLKFTADDQRRRFILSTGDAVLVEASPRDKIWGIGHGVSDSAAQKVDLTDVSTWRGENWLGFALMEAREEIAKVYRYYDVVRAETGEASPPGIPRPPRSTESSGAVEAPVARKRKTRLQ